LIENLKLNLSNVDFDVYREEVKEMKQRDRNRKIKRYTLIGLATVGGGTLIGMFL